LSLRELDLHVDFGLVAVQLLRLGERELRQRIGDLGDDLLDGEEVEVAGFGVEARAQLLTLVFLSGGRLEGVLTPRR
jgi:hypothetical protein